jgi:hypothetical protein
MFQLDCEDATLKVTSGLKQSMQRVPVIHSMYVKMQVGHGPYSHLCLGYQYKIKEG